MPTMQMAPSEQRAAPQAKIASSRRLFTYFISIVEMNRLVRNSDIATMLYVCAVALLMPRLSAY